MKSKNCYLKSSLAVAATGMLPHAAGAEVVRKFEDITAIDGDGTARFFDITGDAVDDYSFVFQNGGVETKPHIAGANGSLIIRPDNGATDAGGPVLDVLPVDTVVGPDLLVGRLASNQGYFYQNWDRNAYGDWGGTHAALETAPDPITGPIEGYLALAIPSGADFNYGYAHFVLDLTGVGNAANSSIRLLDTGYETTINTPVTITPRDPVIVVPDGFDAVTSAVTSTSLEIPVSNSGFSNTLTITSATISGTDDARFTIGETIPLDVAAGVATAFTISFDPDGTAGIFTANLELSSNDTGNPVTTVPLTVNAGLRDLVVPGSLSEGPVSKDAGIQTYQLQLQNNGFAPVGIESAVFSGLHAPQFQASHDFVTGNLEVPGQGTINLSFTFDPYDLGGAIDTVLTLATNDPDHPEVTVSISAQVGEPRSLTILPLGDSITAGNGRGGYRAKMAADLTAAGYEFHLQGSQTMNNGGETAASLLPPFDGLKHEGHGGWRIEHLDENLDGVTNHDGDGNGGYFITGGHETGRDPITPDVICALAGINDVNQHLGEKGAAGQVMDADELMVTLQGRITSLVNNLKTLTPDSHILLGTVIPYANGLLDEGVTGATTSQRDIWAAEDGVSAQQEYGVNHFVIVYNKWLRETFVPAQQAAGTHISLVDQYPNFILPDGSVRGWNNNEPNATEGPEGYADYGLHPNNFGYDLMGATWADGIVETFPNIAEQKPVSAWLLSHGLATSSDMLSDDNNDGVTLLMAYALGLDPNLNLAGSLPAPVLSEDMLSLTFEGKRDDIIYGAQISTGLETWSSTGVTLSEPDANGMRTASVPITEESARFARLVIQPTP